MASPDDFESEKGRKRGFLVEADRKWLLLSREEFIEEHSRQYWGQRRDKIKERTRNAILDFTLLLDTHGKFDVSSVVEGDGEERAEIRKGFISMVGFLYGIARDFRPPSQTLIEMGVEAGSRKWFDKPVEAELTVEEQEVVNIPQVCEVVDSGDLDALADHERRWVLDRVADGAELTGESLRETYGETREGELVNRFEE